MANILYIAQFFSTEAEPGGQGQRHFRHANALVEDGHHVTVITGGSTTMNMKPGVEEGENGTKAWIHPNLRILKVPCSPLARRSVVNRAVNYFAFSLKAFWAGMQLIARGQSFQYVLGSSPPLLIGLVAYLLSLASRAEFLLEIRDLWSQTMAANGFIKNRLAIDLNRMLESFLYRQAGQLIVVSQPFADEIEAQVPGSRKKIHFIPNGADMEFYQYPRLWKGSFLSLSPQETPCYNVVYAGVFSDYTHLETVLDAADRLKAEYPDIRFNLVGGGYQFDRLRTMAQVRMLDNVVFWDALPKNRISKFLMEADLSLINYRALDVFGQVLPNKLFDYLAAGRPILAAVPKGEVSRVLDESSAGVSVAPENVEALVEKIRWFYHNQETGLRMGMQGQQYVRRHFNRAVLVERLLDMFPRVIPLEPARRREAASSKVVPINRVKLPS